MPTFSLLTMNCFGVPTGRTQWRLLALADALNRSDYHLVALQEVQARRYRQLLAAACTSYPAQAFDEGCRAAIERHARRLGYSCMPAVSGAGHDAVYLARRCPTGMVFVPCKDGISHNEVEDARPEHLEAGANVLLHAMLERAGAGG